ncbi:bZIP transcription factor [Aspergillus lucknowensis]|uniref:BZIP domain-containing protein n=1 Tax=Aspergillus lucknowensis TaxID=176173 RepID=A0ABR4M4W3_9EURO
MSTPAAFYHADSMGASGVAPSSLLLSNGFGPEFLSLELLEKANQHDMPTASMPPAPGDNTAHPQGMQPNYYNESPGARIRNRQLRPAPPDDRKRSMDMEMNSGQSFRYPSSFSNYSSTSTSSDHTHNHDKGDFAVDDSRSSYHSDRSSPKLSPTSHSHSYRPDEIQKREKHLERNRVAASKSRQKKKRETDQLKTRCQEASRKKRLLEEEIKGLHSDLLFLKDQILMHSRCDDEAIHVYLGRMVRQATRHESSSTASGEVGERVPPPSSPEQETGRQDRTQQVVMGLSSSQQHPAMGMDGPASLPCNAEQPLIDPMMYQHAGNIFDYQIRIS